MIRGKARSVGTRMELGEPVLHCLPALLGDYIEIHLVLKAPLPGSTWLTKCWCPKLSKRRV